MWKWARRITPAANQPSAGELIAYLDGQLPRERRREVRALLESSWELRSQLADLERDTKCYVDACAEETSGHFPTPEEIWAGMRARNFARPPEPAARVRGRVSVFGRGRFGYPAVWAAAAMLLVGVFVLSRPRAIEAATILEHGQSMETSLWRGRVMGVLHQSLVVRKAGQAVGWQIWNEPTQGRYAERVNGDENAVRELQSIDARNHLDPRRPLSATAYRQWLSQVKVSSQSVTAARTEGGERGFRIDVRLSAPPAEHAILASSLLVRQRDWRPVSQRLTVQGANRSEVYEVSELAYEVVAFEQLSAEVFAPTPAAARDARPASSAVVPAAPALPSQAELFSLEVKVRYALHRLHACSGEPIEVAASAGGVQVRGVAETAGRRRELTRGLAELHEPLLTVSIRTPGEAGIPASLPRRPLEESEGVSGVSQSGRELPIEALVARGPDGERVLGPDAIVQLSNDAVQSGRGLLMEAWAVRRLVERYPQWNSTPDAANRQLLETMLRDHLRAFDERRRRVAEIIRTAQPSLGGSTEPGEVKNLGALPAARDLVEGATQANSLVLALFARGGGGAAGNETVKQLAARLARMQSLSAQLRTASGQ